MAAMPSDPYELLHFNMVRAHATFKLGFENILSWLEDPPMNDLANFLGYCQAWANSIDDHHNTEEAVVFPFLNNKLDFSTEAEQHKIIHAAIDELLNYIRDARTGTTTFDAGHLKGMVQDLRDPLFEHMDAEVAHIEPDKLKVFEEKELLWLDAKLESHAKAHSDPFIVVPYMRSHTPPEYKDVWPPLPWILRKVLIPYVFAMRYSGYWKYSPYSLS